HQYILYYIVSIALVIAADHWRALIDVRLPSWLRATLMALAGVALIYVVLGLIAFFTNGLEFSFANARITATHPQKMWGIAGAVTVAAIGLFVVARFRSQLLVPALGFLIGYLPAIIGRIGNHGIGSPISRLDFAGLRRAWPDITGVMLPMLFGFRDPTTARTV